tara:strand:+ start:611 stop:1600 length:990 start_codon:yes stop_codon:yes gene_type:complete
MKVNSNPYPHLVVEDYLNIDTFNKIKNNISFSEIKSYCTNPDNPEYDSSDNPNYSIPVESTKNLQWLLNEFSNETLFSTLTNSLYDSYHIYKPDHSYVNIHYDCKGSSIDVHNDQKKYRWLVTGQVYLDGSSNDGVILLDHALNEITKVPLKQNLLYAVATSMYSWHIVKPIVEDKISVLFRFGKKQINTITNPDNKEKYCIIIDNDGHYDSHYAKIGMRMAKITEAWLYNQNYKNIFMSDWRSKESLDYLKDRCSKDYNKVIVVPSGYLGDQDILKKDIDPKNTFKVTKENIQNCADYIFHKKAFDNTMFSCGEENMANLNIHWTNYE